MSVRIGGESCLTNLKCEIKLFNLNLTWYGQKELFLGENCHYLVVEFHLGEKKWGHLSW